MFKYLDSWTCFFFNSDTEKSFFSKEEAMKAAAKYCGNNSYTRLFSKSEDEGYIFGPGDGTASVMVRRDIDWEEK